MQKVTYYESEVERTRDLRIYNLVFLIISIVIQKSFSRLNISFKDTFNEFDEFYDDSSYTLSLKREFMRKRTGILSLCSHDKSHTVVHQKIKSTCDNYYNCHMYEEIEKQKSDLEGMQKFLSYRFKRFYSEEDSSLYKDKIFYPISYECITIRREFKELQFKMILDSLLYTIQLLSAHENNSPKQLFPVCSKFVQSLRTSPQFRLYNEIYHKFDDSSIPVQKAIKQINESNNSEEDINININITHSLYLWYMDSEISYIQTAWNNLEEVNYDRDEKEKKIEEVYQTMLEYEEEIKNGTYEIGRDTFDDDC